MKCKICSEETDVVFVINRMKTPVCQGCAGEIFIQQAGLYQRKQSIYSIPYMRKTMATRQPDATARLLNYLNELLGKKHRYTPKTVPKNFVDFISARISDGYEERKIKAVIYDRYMRWKDDERMRAYLRPATLFNKRTVFK